MDNKVSELNSGNDADRFMPIAQGLGNHTGLAKPGHLSQVKRIQLKTGRRQQRCYNHCQSIITYPFKTFAI